MEATLFLDTLRNWQNFYFMIGGAAATLIGLIFIAITFGSHLITPERQEAVETFVTPILFYFISVLAIAMIMLVPTNSVYLLTSFLLFVGLLGFGRLLVIIRQMIIAAQKNPLHKQHWVWNAILPFLSYILILSTPVFLLSYPAAAVLLPLALGVGLLVISGIWRTWDLVIWIATQNPDA